MLVMDSGCDEVVNLHMPTIGLKVSPLHTSRLNAGTIRTPQDALNREVTIINSHKSLIINGSEYTVPTVSGNPPCPLSAHGYS